MAELPEYYFRIRENGALVFRVDTENRNRRIELEQIATVNIRNGEIKPHGTHEIALAEMAAIRSWMAERTDLLALREVDDLLRTVDHLNLATHWVQSKATPEQLEALSDALLMAMHDLRSVLVRKQVERIGKDRDPGEG